MTEKELISKLQLLKQIKPKQEWVFLIKNNILSSSPIRQKVVEAEYNSSIGNVFSAIFGRQFAYSVVVFLFIMSVGFFAVIKGILPGSSSLSVEQNSTASLVSIKDNVEEFKAKSKTLSSLAKNNSSEDVSLAIKEVEDVAKELTDAVKKDPKLAKEIALEINNNKTYLQIEGSNDLKATSDMLYKTIVEQMIKDLDNTTLTESQQDSLNIIKDLYDEGNYTSALESILLLNIVINE